MTNNNLKPNTSGVFQDRDDAHVKVVKRLQALGYPDDRIALACGLSLREVRRILAELTG